MSTTPQFEIPDDIDFRERFAEQNDVSKLMMSCMMDDDDAKDELTEYQYYSRFITIHIRRLGIPRDGGRIMPSSLAGKVCFVLNRNPKIKGINILNAIRKMSNGEVYIETSTSPYSVFFPEKTIERIGRMELRQQGPIKQSDFTKFGEET